MLWTLAIKGGRGKQSWNGPSLVAAAIGCVHPFTPFVQRVSYVPNTTVFGPFWRVRYGYARLAVERSDDLLAGISRIAVRGPSAVSVPHCVCPS